MNKGVKRRFVRKGDVVVVKTDVQPVELSSKDIMNDIITISNSINQTQQQIQTSKTQLTQQESQLDALQESLKEVKKFEEWASGVQLSKLKAETAFAVERAKKKVEDGYKHDESLTVEQNNTQMYHQFREYVIRDEVLNEKISNGMLRAHLANISNPWA